MIFVFLNNKLITLDVILPLLRELHSRAPKTKFEFICFTPATEKSIRENVVLYDVLRELGPLRMLGRRKNGLIALLAHRAGLMASLALIAARLLNPKARLIHFKALNEWPLRALYHLAPTRTLYVESTGIAHTELEKRVDQLNKDRHYPDKIPAAGRLAGFDAGWPPFADPRLKDRPRHVIPPPFRLASWHGHMDRAANRYLGPAFAEFGDVPDRIAVLILSSMDRAPILADPDGFPALFEETLEVLGEAAPELAIAIKPHPATLPRYRAIQKEIVAKRRRLGQRVVITHLHPLLLARRAVFFAGNMFSSTFANAAAMGVPTIEYSNYAAHTLAETGGGSIRPDLVTCFINKDRSELARHVSEFAALNPSRAVGLVERDPQLDALLEALSAGACAPAAENGAAARMNTAATTR